jgi:hypothetical protein
MGRAVHLVSTVFAKLFLVNWCTDRRWKLLPQQRHCVTRARRGERCVVIEVGGLMDL